MKLSTFNAQFDTDSAGPGRGSATVVPDDDTDFQEDGESAVARRLVIFSEGEVHFLGADGVEDTWTLTAGMSYPLEIPVAVKRVYEDSTVAAGDIKAIW